MKDTYTALIESIPHVDDVFKGAYYTTTTPDKVYNFFKDTQSLAQEVFSILTLNTKNQVIARHVVSVGIIDSSLVHPREVFRACIMDNATSVILSHNHPSGAPIPSSADLKVTKQLIGAGEVVGIKVLDHVIIGRGEEGKSNYCSMRETGLVNFS
jgi:DNA repair protein RadC